MIKLNSLLLATLLTGMVGCTNMTPEQQGTLSGAVGGAALGAGFAAITGGDAGVGAVLGGAGGAIIGGMQGR